MRQVLRPTDAFSSLETTLVSGSSIRNVFKKFRGITKNAASDLKSALGNVSSGIKNVDDLLGALPVTRAKRGFLLVGNETVGSVERMLRSADLDSLKRVAKSNVRVNATDRAAMRRLIGETPEISLKTIDDATIAAKRARPQLDSASVNRLSKTAKADVKTVENNLLRRFKQGTIIALTIGVIYVGVDWIAAATESRKGCFMLTTINGKTTSCKLLAFSCIGDSKGECKTPPQSHHNSTLLMMVIAEKSDTDAQKIGLAAAAGSPVADLRKNLATLIDNKYEAMHDYVKTLNPVPTYAPCTPKHPDIEGGVVPPCRACSPTANPTSTQYIDAEMYADNITFQCVENPSILETITDAVISTGEDLWQGVRGGITSLVKNIGIIALVLFAVVALGAFLLNVIRNRRNRGEIHAS